MRTLLLLSCAVPLVAQTSAELVNKAAHDLTAGEEQAAVEEYSQAIRLRLDNPDAWAGRGRAYSSLGKYSNAIDDFDQAIRLNPTAALFTDRGFAYGQLGEFDQAIQDFNRTL